LDQPNPVGGDHADSDSRHRRLATTDLPAAAPSNVSPAAVRSFRARLTIGEDVVDPTTWAGSVPQASGIAPRVRVGRSKWFNLLWLLPIGLGVLMVAVAAAKGLRNTPSVPVRAHRRQARPVHREGHLPVVLAHIEFVEHISEVGGGYGGYNEDHEFFGYRQSI